MSVPPTVSVILPFLDEERFLGEAIESVLGQTRDDWELLLVDDGSTDGSAAIARDYARDNADRIAYLRHEGGVNCGMSASRNLGLARARGRYLAFLDGDDTWTERKLEEQVDLLGAEPGAALVWSPAEWWYSWCEGPDGAQADQVHWPLAKDGTIRGRDALISLIRAPVPNTATSLVRREAAERVGGFEEGFRGMHEDQAFFFKVCLDARIVASSRPSYRWRQHPDSSCAAAVRQGAWPFQRRRFFLWLSHALRSAGVDDRELWRVL